MAYSIGGYRHQYMAKWRRWQWRKLKRRNQCMWQLAAIGGNGVSAAK